VAAALKTSEDSSTRTPRQSDLESWGCRRLFHHGLCTGVRISWDSLPWLQVLTLAASISAGILKRGVSPQSVQEEVQHALELQQFDAGQQVVPQPR
jgi:hypothetical protein